MDEADPQPKAKSRQKPRPPAAPGDPREARLAKALRDNLRRRKQAGRTPAADAAGDEASPLTSLADD